MPHMTTDCPALMEQTWVGTTSGFLKTSLKSGFCVTSPNTVPTQYTSVGSIQLANIQYVSGMAVEERFGSFFAWN